MKKELLAKFTAALVCASLFGFFSILPALAHQAKDLGNYHVEVGFSVEPAYQNQMNALEFFASTKDGQKVEGLEKTVKFEMQAGGKTMSIDVQPVEGDPGHYLAAFMPTALGDYAFHMTGKINELSVDELFQSGPNSFSPVTPLQDAQFPEKVVSIQELSSQVAAANAAASQAQVFAFIGMIVGIAGFAAGGYALFRRSTASVNESHDQSTAQA